MKDLSLKNIITAVKGRYQGDSALLDREISSVVTDSRKLTPGCLFAAIRGETSDGHDYISAALESGALCALAERAPAGGKAAVILVEDTVSALGELAEFYRSRFDIPIIGVTGSVGKTTAKEMLACVLARRFHVHKTEKNFNNNLGVPLTLFGLAGEHEVAVIEMGISHFGEMAQLGKMVHPTMALYTTVGSAHLEFLGDFDGVLKAKTEMLDFVPVDGTVFVNGDDATLKKLSCRQRICSFGLSEGCDVTAENVRFLGADGMALTVVSEGRRFDVRIRSFGLHMVTAALGAAAVGIKMGMTDEEISAGIAAYAPVGGRSAIEKTELLTIVNDCYNANPTSVSAALDSLMLLTGRRVAVLGDMMELGEKELELHREIGRHAAACGVDLLLTSGELSEATHQGAEEAGCENSHHFESKSELIAALPELIRAGDAVLVKASHSKKYEEIVETLKNL